MEDAKWREELEKELDRRCGPLPPKPQWPDPRMLQRPEGWEARWLERDDFSDGRNLDILGYAEEWKDSDDYRKAVATYNDLYQRAQHQQKERDERIVQRRIVEQKLRYHPKFYFPEKRQQEVQRAASQRAADLEQATKAEIARVTQEIWAKFCAEKQRIYREAGCP